MRSFYLLLVLLGILASCSEKPAERTWYKGNLHTHSYWSDGDEFPEMIMAWYKERGYQFVGLSDHNTLAEGEKWKKIQASKLYEDAFADYLKKYGATWVKYRSDSGRTLVQLKTYEEYRPEFEDNNFIIIQSEELTMKLGDKPIHVNATNVREKILPAGGTTVAEILQAAVDSVLRQRESTGQAMFPHVNHPNFFYGVSVDDLIALHGERFFEVYNGHPLVGNYGDSLHPSTEAMWDRINLAYLRRKQPLMYGLATDDSHNYHEFGASFSNAGRGWVMVRAESLTPVSLIEAMEAGDFYASTGVTLDRLERNKHALYVGVRPEEGVRYTIEFIGVRGNEPPATLAAVSGTEGSFEMTDDILFVRARITSSKVKPNPFQEGDYEMAWTQPVTLRE